MNARVISTVTLLCLLSAPSHAGFEWIKKSDTPTPQAQSSNDIEIMTPEITPSAPPAAPSAMPPSLPVEEKPVAPAATLTPVNPVSRPVDVRAATPPRPAKRTLTEDVNAMSASEESAYWNDPAPLTPVEEAEETKTAAPPKVDLSPAAKKDLMEQVPPPSTAEIKSLEEEPKVAPQIAVEPKEIPQPILLERSPNEKIEEPKESAASEPSIQKTPLEGTATATAEEISPVKSKFKNAEGFGKDMALVFALSQIVPPWYAYSIDPNVDQAAKVEWKGGKPWPDVVAEMVAPLGLNSFVEGDTLVIEPGSAMPKPAAPTPETGDASDVIQSKNLTIVQEKSETPSAQKAEMDTDTKPAPAKHVQTKDVQATPAEMPAKVIKASTPARAAPQAMPEEDMPKTDAQAMEASMEQELSVRATRDPFEGMDVQGDDDGIVARTLPFERAMENTRIEEKEEEKN